MEQIRIRGCNLSAIAVSKETSDNELYKLSKKFMDMSESIYEMEMFSREKYDALMALEKNSGENLLDCIMQNNKASINTKMYIIERTQNLYYLLHLLKNRDLDKSILEKYYDSEFEIIRAHILAYQTSHKDNICGDILQRYSNDKSEKIKKLVEKIKEKDEKTIDEMLKFEKLEDELAFKLATDTITIKRLAQIVDNGTNWWKRDYFYIGILQNLLERRIEAGDKSIFNESGRYIGMLQKKHNYYRDYNGKIDQVGCVIMCNELLFRILHTVKTEVEFLALMNPVVYVITQSRLEGDYYNRIFNDYLSSEFMDSIMFKMFVKRVINRSKANDKNARAFIKSMWNHRYMNKELRTEMMMGMYFDRYTVSPDDDGWYKKEIKGLTYESDELIKSYAEEILYNINSNLYNLYMNSKSRDYEINMLYMY